MIAIQITESTGGDVPFAGEDYDLICSIFGAENLNPIITYQWTKNSDSSQIGTNSNTLSFTPARISDAGNEYVCSVTIASSYLSGNIAAVVSHTVRIQSKVNTTVILMHVVIVTIIITVIFTCSSDSVFYYTDK